MKPVERGENEEFVLNLSRRLLLQRLATAGLLTATPVTPVLAQDVGSGTGAAAAAGPAPDATTARFIALMGELSNWKRWGPEDEKGAINLITPAKRKEALALAREGATFSMGNDAQLTKAVDNPQPIVRDVFHPGKGQAPNASKVGYTADILTIPYHNYAQTHINALCHFIYDGTLYNGYSQDNVTAEDGALKNSILNFKNGIVTRGVLMDMARYKGVDWLEPGAAIYPEDLEGWEKKAGVKVEPGDMMIVRTGRWGRRAKLGPWPLSDGLAGLHMDCTKWLHQRDVSILGSDGDQDVKPSLVTGIGSPILALCLVAMGMPVICEMDLELVGQESEKRKRWEFMVTAVPAAIPGGTGSLINPIAMF